MWFSMYLKVNETNRRNIYWIASIFLNKSEWQENKRVEF